MRLADRYLTDKHHPPLRHDESRLSLLMAALGTGCGWQDARAGYQSPGWAGPPSYPGHDRDNQDQAGAQIRLAEVCSTTVLRRRCSKVRVCNKFNGKHERQTLLSPANHESEGPERRQRSPEGNDPEMAQKALHQVVQYSRLSGNEGKAIRQCLQGCSNINAERPGFTSKSCGMPSVRI